MSDNKARSSRAGSGKSSTDKPQKHRSQNGKPQNGKPQNGKTSNNRLENRKPQNSKPLGSKPQRNELQTSKPQTSKTISSKQENSKSQSAKSSNEPIQGEKLQKVLANSGHGSRREIEAMIQSGRISVDGKIATLGDRIEASESIKVRIDGHVVAIRDNEETICRVLAYYKPEGELCTSKDPEGRPTVFDRLPKMRGSRWIAVGRLDVNTSGLMLFTTDGELANRLMHPSREVEREYAVRVFGQVDDDKLRKLRLGVQLEDGPAAFRSLKYQGGEGINQWYHVTLTEGRNREVRRLWEAVEVQVSRLIRIRYGDIPLPKGLPRGGWTEFGLTEVNYLRELVELPRETQSKVAVERDRRKVKASKIRRVVRKQNTRAPVATRRGTK